MHTQPDDMQALIDIAEKARKFVDADAALYTGTDSDGIRTRHNAMKELTDAVRRADAMKELKRAS